MLLSPRVIDEICEIIHGEDFRDQRDEGVFDAFVAMQASGTPVDAVTVADHLRATGDLERVGGPARLHAAITATPAVYSPWSVLQVPRVALALEGASCAPAPSPTDFVDRVDGLLTNRIDTVWF